MRIFLQYYHDFLQKRTQKIELDAESTTTKLLELISQKVGRNEKDLIVRFKRDGFLLRVLPGWSLLHYDITDGLHIQVEIRESESEQKIKESKRLNQRYLTQLFGKQQKLDAVKEDSEGEDEKIDDAISNPKATDSTRMTFDRSKSVSSNEGQSSQIQHRESNNFDKKYNSHLESFQKDLFKIVKSGQLEELEKLIDHVEDFHDEQPENFRQHKIELMKTATFSGWNVLHFAVFSNFPHLVSYFIRSGADINKLTDDGWTPLQLSISQNNIEIFKQLIKEPDLKVNLVTEKGLALNLACKTGRLNMVQMLMQAHANSSLTDRQGYSAADYCNNSPESLQMIQYRTSSAVENIKPSFHVFQPPKPPTVKGFIEKAGGLIFRMSRRYFVLNPDEGTFIRYRKFQDYPMKPLEIIPIRNIRHVQMCAQQWYMKEKLSYFEVFYTSRLILACKNDKAAKAWVVFLFQAAVFSNFQEDRLKSGESEDIVQDSSTEIEITDDAVDISPQIQNLLNKNSPLDLQSREFQTNSDQQEPIKSQTAPLPKNLENKQINGDKISTSPQRTLSKDSDAKQEIKELIKDPSVNFESFVVLKILGSGAFGKVFLVRKKDDNQVYAMKALKKRNLILKKQLKYAVTEANILKQCQHPFILSLHYAFQTPNYLYLVLDYCPGGDLSYHLTQHTKFNESDTRFYIAELVLAIEYLHKQNVVYRDLKPENILLDEGGHIKLADFGLSKEGVGDADKTKSFCGSPAYLSPEMLSQKGAGKSSDVYGVGAVMYEMLTGEPPFYSDDIPTMYRNIKEGVLKFPKNLSEESKNCVRRLLERDPTKRMGTKSKQEIKDDPFFNGLDWNKLVRKEYKPPIIDFSELQDDDIDDDGIGYSGKPVLNDYDYDQDNYKVNRVIKFSFQKGPQTD